MAHVVTNKCVGCKFTDCVVVCPVACFYELERQLVIHPEECIDCMACVDECPVHAIYAGEDVPPEFQSDIEFNATEARSGIGLLNSPLTIQPRRTSIESGCSSASGGCGSGRMLFV